jgi:MerR family transcriptional regulator, light-induced transcriptional regulator
VSLIGLSASGRRSLPDLTKLIVALRISNPAARILVCGQIAASAVALVGLTGADAVAQDFDTAIEAMERLVSAQPTAM